MKKKDNKLYEVDEEVFERRMQRLVVTALIADITAALMLIAAIVLLVFSIFFSKEAEPVVVEFRELETEVETMEPDEAPDPIPEPETEEPIIQEETATSTAATDAEIELLALVTMAEAEGESEEGKRLVIDTILNRVDADRWPNSISEVVYQSGQFVAMSNGRADRCKGRITDELRQLVKEELLSRTNSEVVYFTAGQYGRYGTPLFQVGNHYFCKL